jgi:hypothetical protein
VKNSHKILLITLHKNIVNPHLPTYSFYCSSCSNNTSKPWVEKADTVVVGGGIVGTSIAYHLSKMVSNLSNLFSNRK